MKRQAETESPQQPSAYQPEQPSGGAIASKRMPTALHANAAIAEDLDQQEAVQLVKALRGGTMTSTGGRGEPAEPGEADRVRR